MEKMSASCREASSVLKSISEPALNSWSRSLGKAVDERLIEHLRERVQFIVDLIGRGCIAELGRTESYPASQEMFSRLLLLDEHEYRLVKSELTRAFRSALATAHITGDERRRIEDQIDFLERIFDESIAVSLISALFSQAEKLKSEKHYVTKMLSDTTQLLERERQRLAYDLHDGPAQALSSALLQTDILEDLVASTEAKRELESLKHILGQCLQELRTSIYALKPQSMVRKGLVAKLRGYAKQYSTRTGIKIAFLVEGEERELLDVVEINAFRVIQEALTNVHKHAEATSIIVSITFSESNVFCKVADDGCGFNPSKRARSLNELSGYGLASMKDRVEQFSGIFKVDSGVGKGTCISFNIPLR